MNLLDYIILGVLLISALMGFKKGVISTIVAFAGTLLVIILAFYLKNPISSLLYQNMPFIDLGGKLAGMTIFNILIYEGASYLITLIFLSVIMGIIVKISGIFSKLVNATIILTLPNKLLGLLIGLVEGVILAFITTFILTLALPSSNLYKNSKLAEPLITKTPLLGNITEKSVNSVKEVYEITTNYEDTNDKTEANIEGLNVLLKYEILSINSAENLVNKGKLNYNGAKELIENYKMKGE